MDGLGFPATWIAQFFLVDEKDADLYILCIGLRGNR
jgi:hypothetical protein